MVMISDVRRAFLAFAKSKPAEEPYDYVGKTGPCAFKQFLQHCGYAFVEVLPGRYSIGSDQGIPMPEGVEYAVFGSKGVASEWTWGQVVQRLEELA